MLNLLALSAAPGGTRKAFSLLSGHGPLLMEVPPLETGDHTESVAESKPQQEKTHDARIPKNNTMRNFQIHKLQFLFI